MANNQVFKLYDFSGGLNEKGQNVHLHSNETPYCFNVDFNELGALVKRKGYSSLLDTEIGIDDPIKGLYIFNKNDGATYILAVAGGTLYEINEDLRTSTVVDYDGGGQVNDLTETEYVGFTTWGNVCYIANGIEPIMEFDGTSVVKWDAAIPKGKYITSHKNMVFWSGNPASPSEVYFSDISPAAGTPGDYGSVKFQTDDGDRVMNIIKQQDNLVVFKSGSIHVLYGSSVYNFSKREVQPTIGTVATKSVVNFQNNLFFLSKDGVYIFDGTNTNLVSEKVSPTIDSIVDHSKCSGAINNQKYYLAYSDGVAGTPNNNVLVFSTIHGAWTKYTNYNVSMWSNFDGSQDGSVNLNDLYFGSSIKGQVYKSEQGYDDDGTAIEVEYRTKHLNLDSLEIVKTFRSVMVDNLTVGSFQIIYDVDKGNNTGSFDIYGNEPEPESLWGENTWDELIWSPEIGNKIFGSPLKSGTYGRNIRLIIREESTGELKINGIMLNFRPRRKRIYR